ncbi:MULTISPECIES: carboxymuconolactone decarboxylase family protein [Tsukamurella]|uniref:Carboxymuconolactone decarboxylase family protein n=2 Tax=Tsukamurella TaxID=2060 RepID=A0A5C5RX26_9ACTN|nr:MULTISPECIES: carboxymuconolactone decarboxylase family protein [Tsukamurella]NMD55937.1 carboxymuconolactone decarboxylase family protein [Tsukamurella columbiensis]TWS27619.1 carboxymuconolactone decarboxylase family protein [Tsukamurella conjunctivitidis]
MSAFKLPDIPAESRAILDRLVPPPHRPPLLYLAMAANPEVLRAYAEGPILGLRGLLYTGQVGKADRELCILRVTARCRAEHEWGVHVAYFGKTSGLSDSQVRSTVTDETPTPAWSDRQRAVIAIADSIAGMRPFTEQEDHVIGRELTDAERTEFVATAALYLGISAQCRTLEIPPEPDAPQMPNPC